MGFEMPLTGVEAVRYLRGGELPGNFRERIAIFAEFYQCSNCDGRLCMDCVLRVVHDRCVEDCPDCCEDGKRVAPTVEAPCSEHLEPQRPRVGKQRVHLTDEQVAEMRRRYARGEGPSALARAFDVSPSWAGMIVHRLAR